MTSHYAIKAAVARVRRNHRTPAKMLEAADVLRNPDPAELKALAVKPDASWLESAAFLEREAGVWAAERWEARNLKRRRAARRSAARV